MEPYTLILLCILVMAYILIRLENRRDSRNGKKALLRQSFGAIPQRENRDYGGIEYDWDFEQTNLSEQEQIDEITWNDLEMDAVYLRVNNCRSFAGEQALYTALHRLSQDREAEEALRGKIRYFGEHETERERATYLLHCLGKEHGSYYLPVFIRNLKGFEIPNIQFYRFMRGLLFCSFLPSALLLDNRYLVFPLFTALANLVIYSFQKYKYSANLSMLRATLGVIRTARLLSDPGKSGGGEPFPDLGELAQRFSRSARKIMRLNTREQSGLSGTTSCSGSWTAGRRTCWPYTSVWARSTWPSPWPPSGPACPTGANRPSQSRTPPAGWRRKSCIIPFSAIRSATPRPSAAAASSPAPTPPANPPSSRPWRSTFCWLRAFSPAPQPV